MKGPLKKAKTVVDKLKVAWFYLEELRGLSLLEISDWEAWG